jgi:hypothetical protein
MTNHIIIKVIINSCVVSCLVLDTYSMRTMVYKFTSVVDPIYMQSIK